MLREIISGNFNIWNIIIGILASFAVILLTLPIHEWAHGFIATKLGDPTPRYQGRLTLNPFAHIDYIGALAIIFLGVGWAKPVQINPRNFKNPKVGMAITALAGPVANILMAAVMMLLSNVAYLLPASLGNIPSYIAFFFSSVAYTNIYLAVFNLIPVPPFDGSRILNAVLPDRYYFKLMQYERYSMFIVLIIIATGILDKPLSFISDLIFNVINFVAVLPFIFLYRG